MPNLTNHPFAPQLLQQYSNPGPSLGRLREKPPADLLTAGMSSHGGSDAAAALVGQCKTVAAGWFDPGLPEPGSWSRLAVPDPKVQLL